MCKGTNNVLENKKCASAAHYGIELSCLPCMALCGLVLPCLVLCGLMWPCVAICGFMWPYVTSYGLVASFHGHGHVRPHST